MNPPLRPHKIGEAIQQAFLQPKRREVTVNPEGGFWGTKDLASALRRANSYDRIILPTGEYGGFTLKKSVEIRGEPGATVVFTGTVKVATEQALFVGLEFRSAPDVPAIVLEKGEVILRQCTVRGEINAASTQGKATLCVQECQIGSTNEGIIAGQNTTLEIIATRVSQCRIGISLREGARCALHSSRVEGCQSTDAANPGAGIFVDKASIYCEGSTLSGNDVAAYLNTSKEAIFLFTYFHSNRRAAIIATGDGTRAEPSLITRSCSIDRQELTGCPQIMLSGEQVNMRHTRVAPGEMTALSADDTQLVLEDVHFASRRDAALDLRGCRVAANECHIESPSAPAIVAENCQGNFRLGIFRGSPPTLLTSSPQLQFESCELEESREGASSMRAEKTQAATIDELLNTMRRSIRQNTVRTHLERILRQAHATAQRKRDGLPAPEQSFHCAFTGQTGTGKLAAAQLLTRGLNAFGFVESPTIKEVASQRGLPTNGVAAHGAYFVRIAPEEDAAPSPEPVEQLVTNHPEALVILDGEREDLRRFIRSSPILTRAFRDMVHFSTYGPPELATLFSQLCEKDRIAMSPDTARLLLIAFHLYHDRKDKRFANAAGVESIYLIARRNYLERCSIANRSDLEMEPKDLGLPPDKILRATGEGSPIFVTFCPSCSKENPWTTGLPESQSCLHCETTYQSLWGIWTESAYYRHLHDVMAQGYDETAITRRSTFTARVKQAPPQPAV